MNKVRGFLTSIALLALMPSCATEAPTQAPSPAATPLPPPPAGSQRVPGTLACETEVSCAACSDDNDKDLMRMAPLVHAAKVRACYERGAQTHAGSEGRVVFRIGVDPTGVVGTSCVVRSSLNDETVESCLADLVLTWKFAPPKSGGWAVVDQPFVFPK